MKYRTLLLTIALLFGFCLAGLRVAPAVAESPFEAVCTNATTDTSGSSVCGQKDNADNPISGPNGVIVKGIQLLNFVIGVAAIFVIIISGIRYITSSGDPSAVNNAKNTLLYAVIGVVVAALSQTIVVFVVKKL